MNSPRIIAIVGLLALGAASVEARNLRHVKNPDCPESGGWDYFQDDNTKRVYCLTTNCDGTTCLRPFTGPIQPERVVKDPISLPTNWFSLMAASSQITAPGAELPMYIIDADGVQIHFRNPIDSAEDAYYRMLYLTHEQTGLARALGPAGPPAWYPEIPDAQPTQPDPDWRISNDLFRRYMDLHYGTAPRPAQSAAEEEASGREDLRVMAQIDVNHSNLLVSETPSGTNGYLLKVFPIAPELASDITVSRADGQIIWSGGSVPDAVSIDMSGQPSGMYFVRGLGKSIVVTVVR